MLLFSHSLGTEENETNVYLSLNFRVFLCRSATPSAACNVSYGLQSTSLVVAKCATDNLIVRKIHTPMYPESHVGDWVEERHVRAPYRGVRDFRVKWHLRTNRWRQQLSTIKYATGDKTQLAFPRSPATLKTSVTALVAMRIMWYIHLLAERWEDSTGKSTWLSFPNVHPV